MPRSSMSPEKIFIYLSGDLVAAIYLHGSILSDVLAFQSLLTSF